MGRFATLRLTAPTLCVGLVLLAVCLGTAWYVHRLQQDISSILSSNVTSMRSAEELEISLREVRNQLDGYLLTGDERHLQRLPRLRKETDHWLAEAESVATTPREQELMLRVRRGYEHFFTELARIVRRPPDESERREMRRLIDRLLMEEILPPAHEYLDFNEEMASSAAARNQQAARWTVLALMMLGICGPAGGLLAGLGIAQRFNRTLVRLSLPIRDVTGLLNDVVEPVTFAPGGGFEELEGVLERITERVGEVIDRMQQSQQEALRAEQLAALGQLAAGIAHELRNPLMSMKILVQAALVRGAGGLKGRGLSVLEEEITRLERLTATLLDYARPPQLEKQLIEIGELLEDTICLLSGQAGRRDVRIDYAPPDSALWLQADSGQVRQVVFNLLLNALHAVGEGGSVVVRTAMLEDGRVEVAVEDSGPGLPHDLSQDIFHPFVSTKPTGLGLGLSVCKRIVEAHGGEIAASNRAKGGAVFRVRLPGEWESPRRLPVAA